MTVPAAERLTHQQHDALGMLVTSRRNAADTGDGVASTETFYDREVHVAYIHWRTARSLQEKGLVEFGGWDPDYGTEITLTAAGLAQAEAGA